MNIYQPDGRPSPSQRIGTGILWTDDHKVAFGT